MNIVDLIAKLGKYGPRITELIADLIRDVPELRRALKAIIDDVEKVTETDLDHDGKVGP